MPVSLKLVFIKTVERIPLDQLTGNQLSSDEFTQSFMHRKNVVQGYSSRGQQSH